MRKALRRIFFLIYLFTMLPLAACYLSQWISPASVWPLAFFGLVFPALIAVQFAFVILFLIFRSKAVVLPIVLIILGWNSISHTFQIPRPAGTAPEDKNAICVMTYNVRLFDIAHYWSGLKDQSEGVFSYVTELKPDILCFQEFALQDPGKFSIEFIKNKLAFLPHSAIEFNFTSQNRKHGLAIFSRYPIIRYSHEHFEDTKNMMLYADILIGIDTIRVYNNHLESIHFDRDEFQWIDTTNNKTRIPHDKITEIINRMKGAYIKRASQADIVRKNIDNSPYKVIVCGDFNDTPVSYTAHKIGSNLYDSFRSGGQWLGITFPNVKAPLRIDYILHSKEMVSSGYQIGKVKYSDHRPVSCNIAVGSRQ
ncbi:MAG: endonuclease/exonuclease/phosphatase family protein [Bacteroidia bacterium]|nr:endonuclease/exonuclease/phosphatase family protein [Bacteroidia bacterium]